MKLSAKNFLQALFVLDMVFYEWNMYLISVSVRVITHYRRPK